jgi:hypothetical protein
MAFFAPSEITFLWHLDAVTRCSLQLTCSNQRPELNAVQCSKVDGISLPCQLWEMLNFKGV